MPTTAKYAYWSLSVSISSIYTAFQYPYIMNFGWFTDEFRIYLLPFLFTCEFIGIVDIIISFFVSYKDENNP